MRMIAPDRVCRFANDLARSSHCDCCVRTIVADVSDTMVLLLPGLLPYDVLA